MPPICYAYGVVQGNIKNPLLEVRIGFIAGFFERITALSNGDLWKNETVWYYVDWSKSVNQIMVLVALMVMGKHLR